MLPSRTLSKGVHSATLPSLRSQLFKMAEREGFEPPVGCPTTVFKTAALSHSAISPKLTGQCFTNFEGALATFIFSYIDLRASILSSKSGCVEKILLRLLEILNAAIDSCPLVVSNAGKLIFSFVNAAIILSLPAS